MRQFALVGCGRVSTPPSGLCMPSELCGSLSSWSALGLRPGPPSPLCRRFQCGVVAACPLEPLPRGRPPSSLCRGFQANARLPGCFAGCFGAPRPRRHGPKSDPKRGRGRRAEPLSLRAIRPDLGTCLLLAVLFLLAPLLAVFGAAPFVAVLRRGVPSPLLVPAAVFPRPFSLPRAGGQVHESGQIHPLHCGDGEIHPGQTTLPRIHLVNPVGDPGR
mmetsp:Transcript_53296/g.121489  ORF Transcript_53296/g.121489 Transcript_53296/m.121489 type:complete len:217 (-) Transcript_53296:1201-1851(-)